MSRFYLGVPSEVFTFGTTMTTTAAKFSFSTPVTRGFNFGIASQAAASTPSTNLFSLTTQAPTTQNSGFHFGASGGTGFSLGINIPKLNPGNPAGPQTTVTPSAFGVGSSTNATVSTVTSGQATETAPRGLEFGSSITSTPATNTSECFSLTGGSTTQTRTPGFCTAQFTGLARLPFALTTTAPTTMKATQATQPVTAVPTTTSISTVATFLASTGTAPASSASPIISLCPSTTSTTTRAPGGLDVSLKFPCVTSSSSTVISCASATTTTTTAFTLNQKALAPAGIPSSTSATEPTLAVPSATVEAPAHGEMTYSQLESLINNWSLELKDQDWHLLKQAKQVNAWGRALIQNGEKISTLLREVEKVKLDQKRLDQELNFILSQQKKLEDLLSPLEEAAKEQRSTIYLLHADEERENIYKLAENIYAQLKGMAQDLKDIIEHLNTSGAPFNPSDPLQQICKILSMHMDSLRWVDQNSVLLQRRVEEASKLRESGCKKQNHCFYMTFN